jgi:hypothetical protein
MLDALAMGDDVMTTAKNILIELSADEEARQQAFERQLQRDLDNVRIIDTTPQTQTQAP